MWQLSIYAYETAAERNVSIQPGHTQIFLIKQKNPHQYLILESNKYLGGKSLEEMEHLMSQLRNEGYTSTEKFGSFCHYNICSIKIMSEPCLAVVYAE
jgi:hypothetical protein